MSYLAIKYLHVTCVIVSGSGFFLRGLCLFFAPCWLEQRGLRVLPHAVDTLLLASAVALAVMSGQYPLAQNWLSAKVLGLLVYIACGMIALKRGKSGGARTPRTRAFFFVAALLAFGYIVSVALTRSPLGVLALAH